MSIDNLGNTNLNGIQEATVDATWTAVTTADDNLAAIAWSPSLELFAAVPYSGGSVGIITSPDGESWTARTTPASDGWRGLVWANGIFCAVGEYTSTARTMTSSNGIDWTTATNVPENADYQSVAWSEKLGIFAAVTDDSVTNQVMTSLDGINWLGVTVPTPAVGGQGLWYAICWSPDLEQFTAVARSTGASTEQVLNSSDGITWTLEDAYATGKDWRGVAWGGPVDSRLFVAVASNSSGTADVMTSTDGITWSNASITGVPSNNWQEVTWGESVGLFCACSSTGSGNQVMTSPDGLTWTSRTTPGSSFYQSVAWGPKQNDFFAAIRATTATAVTKSNSDYSLYVQSTTMGNQGISDVTVTGRDITIGQSSNDITLGAYANQITLGSPGVPVNIGDSSLSELSKVKLLYSGTVSSVANIDFTDLVGYSSYKLIGSDINFSNDAANFFLRTSTDNGSTFDSGASDYSWTYMFGFLITNGADGSNTSPDIKIITGVSNLTSEPVNFDLTLYKPNVVNRTFVSWNLVCFNASSIFLTLSGSGTRLASSSTNAFRILPSAGTISGTFQLIGYR